MAIERVMNATIATLTNNVLTSLLSRKAIPSYPYTPPESGHCTKKRGNIALYHYHLCTTICNTLT